MKKAVILNDTSFDSHHGCEIVMKNIIQLLKEINIETIDTNPVGMHWIKNKKFIQNMNKADIVIVNGEGTLHHASTRVKELVTIGKYIKEKLFIPVVLINATYQNNGQEIANYMKFFDLIFVRESMSKNDLMQYHIESQVVPDLTFYSQFDILNKNETTISGITDNVYLDLSEKLFKLSLEQKYLYLPALTNPKLRNYQIKSILKFIKYHLYKNIKYILWHAGYKLDHYSIRTFYYTNNYKNYIQKIANLNFIIISKYHSLCFALKTFTPFLAIRSNSFKIESMLRDIGFSNDRIIDFTDLQNLELKEFTKQEYEKIKLYVDTAPLKIKKMFKQINLLLNDKEEL